MSLRKFVLSAIAVWAACMVLHGCGGPAPSTAPAVKPATQPVQAEVKLVDAIPPEKLGAVIEAQLKGLGHMERYEYPQATEAFRKAHELAPGWIAGSINLAIALLNDSGQKQEELKKSGGTDAGVKQTFHQALDILDDVLVRDPKNLHAHFCRGLILESMGPPTGEEEEDKHPHRMADAHKDFLYVTQHDPTDAHAWYRAGSTLPGPRGPDDFQDQRKQAPELIHFYTKALECNPCLVPALYKLSREYSVTGRTDDYKKVIDLFNRLNPQNNASAPGDIFLTYGEMGKYSRVIELRPKVPPAEPAAPPPRFETLKRLVVPLRAGERWVADADFKGPLALHRRVRARFGSAIAAFDADGDGKTDLYLASAVHGADGVRDALLLNRGEGRFEDGSEAFHLPKNRASLGVAAGDFDADGNTDLFLTGVGDNRLLRNRGKEAGFEDVTGALGPDQPQVVSLTARWFDIDQDGDLDLYVVNHTAAENAEMAFAEKAVPGVANMAFRNDGVPEPQPGVPRDALAPPAVSTGGKPSSGLSIAFKRWDDDGSRPLLGGEAAHTAVAAVDIDLDRDLDLVLAADGAVTTVVLNDRLGRFHSVEEKDLTLGQPITGLLVCDVDRDGRPDLAAVPSSGRVAVWRNLLPKDSDNPSRRYRFEFWPEDAHDWRQAQVVDLDLDGTSDLLGLPVPASDAAPEWSRNEGNRFATRALALGPDELKTLDGLLAVDLAGDALPDLLLVRDAEGPRLARNLGNGQHWLGIDLGGRWKPGPEGGPMRTNPHGLGARLLIQGPNLNVSYSATSPEAGLAQTVAPQVFGLGSSALAGLIRLNWPDGVMQCELNKDADQVVALAEICRKAGSCPVLFTWNGERFVCLGDFLGGGGLGYLVAPGEYSQPDRDEAVAIAPDQLKAVGGVYYLSVTEPMDELAYIDKLTLDVVDRPPGIMAAPDERFAPGGNRPTGDLLAWKETVAPVRATDLAGNDVLELLREWDRRTVDAFKKLPHWTGYTEEHGIVLDFGDTLRTLSPNDRVILCLAGWVEYPYSQTNYAAATAGVALKPPVLERRRADGGWEVLESDPGYPAGMPRLTTLDLTGKLTGPECVIRLRTNMECYWDQAFLAFPSDDHGVRVNTLPVAKAVLGDRGYTREISPDGRLPLLYDYEHVDPVPLARLEGHLTRYGDVAGLLHEDDDRLCLVGPGDEIRLEFDANALPPLPDGWTRSYVLRAVGYCKDADPFTATSDHVGPLPWKGMGPYPFGPEGERPQDEAYRTYLRTYQTRAVGR